MAAYKMKTMTSMMLKCRGGLVADVLRHMSSASSSASFKYSDLEIELTKTPREKPDADSLVFGKEFADHMLTIDWSMNDGWDKPRIMPLQNFSIHPAAKVFHYAVELYEGLKAYRGVDNKIRIFRPELNMSRMTRTAERATLPDLFEGMKAYRGVDKKIRMFRPEKNMIRMRSSAERSSLPDFSGEELIKCMKKLVSIDKEWVPYSTSSTLYIRPTMIATEPSLGVSKTTQARLFVITGPVGPYYPTGFNPVSLLADPQYVRAWEGGCGSYKMGSNYAPTIHTQIEAATRHNCQQVLWLYGPNHQVTEVGTMNFFMHWINEHGEEELITPPLASGLILPGVTRSSLIELAKQWGDFKMTERDFTMKDIVKALKEKRIKEMFGAGTACIVCPIKEIIYEGSNYDIPTMSEGAPITNRFLNTLTDIQYGRVPSDWMVEID